MAKIIKQNTLIDAYILMAWETLRGENSKGERYPAVHTAWTPFNRLFRQLFDGIDPVEYTKMLESQGLITLGIAKGGALLKPCESFLKPAPVEHQETITLIHHLLSDAAAHAKARQKKAQAQKAWESGDTKAALKRLGYG